MACIYFNTKVINLSLPFSNNFIKVSASLLSDDGGSMHALIFQLNVFQFCLKTMLSLLGTSNLLVQSLDSFLSLTESSCQLLLSTLKFINPTKSISFKLGFPQLNLS